MRYREHLLIAFSDVGSHGNGAYATAFWGHGGCRRGISSVISETSVEEL